MNFKALDVAIVRQPARFQGVGVIREGLGLALCGDCSWSQRRAKRSRGASSTLPENQLECLMVAAVRSKRNQSRFLAVDFLMSGVRLGAQPVRSFV